MGAKLAEAAHELQDAGTPPADALVDDLATARGEFTDLRTDVLAAAETLDIAAPEHLESLRSLHPILETLAAAVQAQVQRAALEQARVAVLGVLDRVAAVTHSDDPDFAPLLGCQAKARDLREAVLALTDAQSPEAMSLTDDIRAFSDFLTMLASDAALDDERFAQLEESVSRTLGRPLAVAAARGRLMLAGQERPRRPEPVVPEPVPEPEPLGVETGAEPQPVWQPEPEPAVAYAAAPTLDEEPERAASTADESSAPDETAQWWLAAWARWSGWKSSLNFTDAVKEELGKYPYLLSVPIQQSPQHEDGLLAYGYSIVMEHVERHCPGCVGNALNSLKAGQTRPVGEQLYDYLVTEGRLGDTYPEFVKNVMFSALPEPGVWFQARILESKDDTRVLQRPTPRIGDSDQTGQRLATDGQRFTEHRFTATVAPLTTRFFLASADIKEARGVDVRLTVDGSGSTNAWLLTIPAPGKANTKIEARRLTEGGMALPGLGKDYSTLWIAVFNDDPAREKTYELGITLKKDAKSPFGSKARAAS
ncbi:MAG TPA: hypothetical protein VMR23_07325 [Candidatus Limnocylindria bacterium]|nr:hypothetical protein [Candidatus Limnocylindria bacterium]